MTRKICVWETFKMGTALEKKTAAKVKKKDVKNKYDKFSSHQLKITVMTRC